MKVAVLIAVEKYSDTRIASVQFAEADATALAGVLEQHGFAAADRIVLVSDQATKSSIESRVKRVLKGLCGDDELVFYYAGHGFLKRGTNFITCYDTDADDWAGTSIELNWLYKQFQDSDCTKIAFFLDACACGLPAKDDIHDDCTGLNDTELKDFFESREHCVCFAACKANESSHTSGAFKHGIWAYHVIEAFDGRAPAALADRMFLTSASLQNYLKRAIPRTLTKTFATKKVQTPWMAGAGGGEFCLADLTDLLAKRRAAATSRSGPIKNVTFLAQRTTGVRSLSGFKKSHKAPDRMSGAAEAFIADISSGEITGDINGVFAKLRSAFRFKRADMHITNHGDGTATIITPYFNYSITVELDSDDTSQVIFRRKVDAIREPDQILSESFAEVFENVFDTIEFDTPSLIDLPAFIDHIEDLDDDRITIDYDPEVTHCTLHVDGIVGAITITSGSLSIVHSKPGPPGNLLQSFFGIQSTLVDQHDVKLIPFHDGQDS